MVSGIFEQFVKDSPISVMQRALMENLFAPAKLNAGFGRLELTIASAY
ncbi:MAG TPA: hypothetical protein VMV69_17620 [Pirellulales bacterium]|nr:hypothetical protein [Pirellulales bacterium]